MPADGLKSDQFGLLAGKNYSVDGRVSTHTGYNDLTKVGNIMSFNGKEKYDVWPTEACDTIKGGDGSFMPPNMNMNSKVEIAVIDLCRTLPLVPTKPVMVGHLNALRFVPHPDVFNYRAKDNRCYCSGLTGDSVESG